MTTTNIQQERTNLQKGIEELNILMAPYIKKKDFGSLYMTYRTQQAQLEHALAQHDKTMKLVMEEIDKKLNQCKNMIVNIPIYTLEKDGEKVKTAEKMRQICAEIVDDYQEELKKSLGGEK